MLLVSVDSSLSVGQICWHVVSLLNFQSERPAIVFVNPHAGRGRSRRRLEQVRVFFSTRSVPAEFILPQSIEEMESRVRGAISAGHRVLLAMGGDGTVQCLVNAAQNSEVLLGILPAGGGNDFAVELGLPKDPVSAAEVLLSARPRSVDLLRARTADGCERLYVGGGGRGVDGESARYSAGPYARLPGRLRYVAAGLRALREFKPLQIRAEFPGSELRTLDSQVMIAGVLNTRSYGAGLRLAPQGRVDDGLLTTVFVKTLSTPQVLAVIPRLITRGDLPESYVTRVSAARVRLSCNRECLFHGDGEILGPAPVDIEVLPRAVQVLVPLKPYKET